MQALRARLSSLATGQPAFNEEQQQDEAQFPQPEGTHLELESSRFHDGSSHPIGVSGAHGDARTSRPPEVLGSMPEIWDAVSISDISSECAAASSGMGSGRKSFDDNLPVSSATQSSLDPRNQMHHLSLYHLLYELFSVAFAFLFSRLSTHPRSTDATLSIEGTLVQSSTHPGENSGIQNQSDVLQKLAAYRMTVMGLRSDAKEQSKAIRRLYIEVFDDVSSVVAVLKEHTPNQITTESGQLSDRINAISSQLSSIKETRKAFDKSQNRLLSVEWKMMEEENKLYPEYHGKGSPRVSEDETSDNVSSLASIPIPSSSDEEQPVQALQSPALSPVQYEDLKDALTEAVVSGFVTLGDEHIEPIPMLLAQELDGKLLGPERAGTGDISLALSTVIDQVAPLLPTPGRFLRSIDTLSETRSDDKQALRYVGLQFSDIPEDMLSAKQDGNEGSPLTPEDVPTSTYTVSGISRWLAYGSPWSSFATAHRHYSYHLPGGMSTLQRIMVKNYESVILGLPMSEQLHYMTDLVDGKTNTARSLLLHNWLWDPVSRFDHVPILVPATGEKGDPTRVMKFQQLARKISGKNLRVDVAQRPKISTSLPITTYSTNTVRSNAAVSRNSSPARSLP